MEGGDAMIRVLDIPAGGPPKVLEGDKGLRTPSDGASRWVDIEAPTPAQMAVVAQRFRLHPLAIEDCLHFDQRPKLEEYDDHLFLVTHGFELRGEASSHPQVVELHSFLGDDFLITVHDDPLVPLDRIWQRLLADQTTARRGVDFIRYLLADAMVDALFPIVDQVAEQIDAIEDRLLRSTPDQAILEEILQIKRLLTAMRRVLPPQRDVLALLSKREDGFIRAKTAPYFRDVYDHLLRIHESLEANRELLGHVLDAHQWTVSQRTNVIMKRLTLVSVIFLPLTFITGFFGQNFEGLPFDSNRLMATMLIGCAVVPTAMLFFFLRSRWF
jgi:magnesium transporter